MKNDFKDGVYDISNEIYHAASAYSRSSLMLLEKSPRHFWHKYLSGMAKKNKSTESMDLGSAFHTLLLEPGKFNQEFAVWSKVNRTTKAGKELWSKFNEEHSNKIILTTDQYEQVLEMVNNVKQHEIVLTLLDDSVFEQSIFWTDKETGLQFKCRPDIWSSKMAVDLKTTKDASSHLIQRSAVGFGYYLQAGMIYEACRVIEKPIEMFVHLFCEKEEPYLPYVYLMKENALKHGIEQFNELKRKLSDCLSSDKWPLPPVMELDVPRYAIKNKDEEE